MRKKLTFLFAIIIISESFFLNTSVDVSGAEALSKPVISVRVKNDSATISISKTENADGYKIYMKPYGEKKYKAVATINKNGSKKRKYTVESLSKGTYFFKVKAYSKTKKKTIWSAYSEVNKVKIIKVSGNVNKALLTSAKKGDIVKFGSYEQDNNIKNGKEPIEWIVLKKNDSEMLLLSRYGLDSISYNERFDKMGEYTTTWEKCTVRSWLNNEFYKYSFSDTEKKFIAETSNHTSPNPWSLANGGKDTIDNVFLLSLDDVKNTEYGFADNWAIDDDRKCAPTKYAIARGAEVDDENKTKDGKATSSWWLRSPGMVEGEGGYYSGDTYYECYVAPDSNVYDSGSNIRNYMVRPAITIDLSGSRKINDKDNMEIVTLGAYEQDNNLSNGSEPIEWIVLKKDSYGTLLLSKYALDCKLFEENDTKKWTWEKSTIREWLNNEFYDTAFNDKEKSKILYTSVGKDYLYAIKGDLLGNEKNVDRIFLFTAKELEDEKYGFGGKKYNEVDFLRICAPTAYAVANGSVVNDKYMTNEGLFSCNWWCRTYGNDARWILAVNYVGHLGSIKNEEGISVRPAMYIANDN